MLLRGQALQFGSFLLQNTCVGASKCLGHTISKHTAEVCDAYEFRELRAVAEGMSLDALPKDSACLLQPATQLIYKCMPGGNRRGRIYLAQSDHVVVQLIQHCNEETCQ